MSLKVKERAQKCWAISSALLCKVLPQECWTLLKGNRPLPMECRILLYIVGVLLGLALLQAHTLFLCLLPEKLQNHPFFPSAFAVFILTFPSVTINWFIKNRDVSQQQNETLFSNSLQLLFKENDIIANSIGLKELVKLKREGRIDSERVDLITSSGLQIREAKLQGANLRKANLQRANLKGVDLRGADIQAGVYGNARYDKETQFPDGFNPELGRMTKVKIT